MIGPPGTIIRIYKPYLVSPGNAPQEVSIYVIRNCEKCKSGGNFWWTCLILDYLVDNLDNDRLPEARLECDLNDMTRIVNKCIRWILPPSFRGKIWTGRENFDTEIAVPIWTIYFEWYCKGRVVLIGIQYYIPPFFPTALYYRTLYPQNKVHLLGLLGPHITTNHNTQYCY